MNAAAMAKNIAAGRILIGLAMCVAPGIQTAWIGRDAKRTGAQVVIRALGIRDLALGVGTMAAADSPGDLRRWLMLSGACDAVDFAATTTLPPSPQRTGVLGLASSAAVASVALALALRD
jgi:hypothetical protein